MNYPKLGDLQPVSTRRPSTKSDPEEISRELEKLDLNMLLKESLEKAEVVEF